MTKDTGGPANPVFIVASSISREELVNLREVLNKTPGLTVRDYFAANTAPVEDMGAAAAEAITGLKLPIYDNYPDKSDFWVDSIGFWAMANAKYRYMQADAMLEARHQ